jgi:hypothetical protein
MRSEKQEPWALSFSEAVQAGFPPATGSTGHRKVGCGIACGGSQVHIAGQLGKQNGNSRVLECYGRAVYPTTG